MITSPDEGVDTMAHDPVLARAFAAFESVGVRWAVLRGLEPNAAGRDIDLVVDPVDRARAARILEAAGFGRLHEGHDSATMTYARFLPESDRWLRLDLTHALGNPWTPFDLGGVLERTSVVGGARQLATDDAFWTLLLHAVLEHGEIDDRHAARLERLASSASLGAPILDAVRRAHPDLDPGRLIRSAVASDWATVRDAILATPGSSAAPRTLPAALFTPRRVVRRAGRMLGLPSRSGLAVALLASPGVGKSTLAGQLRASYVRQVTVLEIDPGTRGGGQLPVRSPSIGHRLARAGRLLRAALAARLAVRQGRLVVWDHHPLDEQVMVGVGRRTSVLRRLLTPLIPLPELIVVLGARAEIVPARTSEGGLEATQRLREACLAVADRLPGVITIDAKRTSDEIRHEIVASIWARDAGRPDRQRHGEGDGAVTLDQVPAEARPKPSRTRASMALSLATIGYRIKRRGRREAARWRLARDRRLVPQIMSGIERNRVPAVDTRASEILLVHPRWRIRRSHAGPQGISVMAVADADAERVVKIAATPAGRHGLRQHARVVRVIADHPGLADLRPVLPLPIASGAIGGKWFLVEPSLRGVPASALDAAGQLDLLPCLASAIGVLHASTSCSRTVDARLLDRWVSRRVARVASIANRRLDAQRREGLAQIEREARSALNGRTLRVGWIHGDYWAGNTLVTDGAVTGIVDWDSARSRELPLQDLMHLVISVRRLREGSSWGSTVASLLPEANGVGGPGVQAADQALRQRPEPGAGARRAAMTELVEVERIVLAESESGLGGLSLRIGLLLHWLLTIESSHRRFPRTVTSRPWIEANILPVLDAMGDSSGLEASSR